jgi:hypothetical protein
MQPILTTLSERKELVEVSVKEGAMRRNRSALTFEAIKRHIPSLSRVASKHVRHDCLKAKVHKGLSPVKDVESKTGVLVPLCVGVI